MTRERFEHLEELQGLPPRTAAQEARLDLIFKPFPPIMPGRRLPASYPWAGTIVGDTFYGNPYYASRRPGAADIDDGGFFVDAE